MLKRGDIVKCPMGDVYVVGGVDPIQGGIHLAGKSSRDGKPFPPEIFTRIGSSQGLSADAAIKFGALIQKIFFQPRAEQSLALSKARAEQALRKMRDQK